ncbi:MAG TPA: type II toxin-antitoxin system prevent-host-death family antitoxin [bacterium]|nr:type II toxin-antitoxin system prevent-host-death family antitoxin [bacterium]
MAISLFKANALRLIEQVARFKESLIITKRGKALAEIVPIHSSNLKPRPGLLVDTLDKAGDLISPVSDASAWEACK